MVNNLLEAGLTGLANTRKVHGDQWFHGHHGAAVLAAHFITHDFNLSAEVQSLVTQFAQDTMARHPDLFRCEYGDTSLVGLDPLVAQLEASIDALSADGHDVIFASLALRALHERPDLATTTTVSAIIELLRATELDNPQRYYGYANYLQDEVAMQNVPEFDHVDEAVTFALAHHDIVYPDQAIDGKYYFWRAASCMW
ncbi:MAG: hypothetical protein AAF993_08765 [Pseudomonadota bacterium]